MLRFGLIAIVLSCGCGLRQQPKVAQIEGATMGTTYVAKTVPSLDAQDAVRIKERIDAALAELNRQMSIYDPESELSRFNRYDGADPFPVSRATASVVASALQIYEQSDGAFDATVGPLVSLWGFGSEGRRDSVPDKEQIVTLLSATGSDNLTVQFQPPALSKSVAGVQIDLGGIAKGYGCDLVSSILIDEGISNHMVEIGGEVVAIGKNENNQPWRIGIERPIEDVGRRSIQRVLALSDQAMATSGDYRNYFTDDGRRYSHTIDPRTGYPVEHSLASVTVVAPNCMTADALATAVMVLGPELGLDLLESFPKVEGLLLIGTEEGAFIERSTTGLKKLLQSPPALPRK